MASNAESNICAFLSQFNIEFTKYKIVKVTQIWFSLHSWSQNIYLIQDNNLLNQISEIPYVTLTTRLFFFTLYLKCKIWLGLGLQGVQKAPHGFVQRQTTLNLITLNLNFVIVFNSGTKNANEQISICVKNKTLKVQFGQDVCFQPKFLSTSESNIEELISS